MKTNFADQLISLGTQMSEERSAAGDLWTHLPSHKVAEKHHGDYAMEFAPAVKDIMIEASLYIHHLKHPERPLDQSDKEWFYTCPCGEGHSTTP